MLIMTSFASMRTTLTPDADSEPISVSSIKVYNTPFNWDIGMLYTVLNFFCFPFIPKVFTNVSTSTANHIQEHLSSFSTFRTIPFVIIILQNFAFKAAGSAVIQFSIHFSIHDCVINMLLYIQNRILISNQIRDLHIAYGASATKFLVL